MSTPSLARRTSRWRSKDPTERHVRAMLETRDDYFENHFIDNHSRGEFLPLMIATVPGHFNKSGHGIDVFARDFENRLWIVEVSKGRRFGATVAKGGGQTVQYAGGVQMSRAWRQAAKDAFLVADARRGFERTRALLDLPNRMPASEVNSRFGVLYVRHRKAVIIPDGGHFMTDGTDLDFIRDVYTYPEHGSLLDMWYDGLPPA